MKISQGIASTVLEFVTFLFNLFLLDLFSLFVNVLEWFKRYTLLGEVLTKNLYAVNFQYEELDEEEQWRIEHAKLHEKHRGHEQMHMEIFLILIVTLVVAQIALVQWKKRHFKSYQVVFRTVSNSSLPSTLPNLRSIIS